MEEKRKLIIVYKEKINKMIQNKESDKILPFLQDNMDTIKYDNDLMVIWYLGMMTQKEVAAGMPSVFDKENSMLDLLDRYHKLKFYLRRIEYDVMEDANEFLMFLSEKNVSEYELIGMVDSVNYDKAKIWKYF